MFREDQFFEGKVLLRSYKDALSCIKVSAERKKNQDDYTSLAKVIIEAKKNKEEGLKHEDGHQGEKQSGVRETKLFQFSNFIFKKYLGPFDEFSGDYDTLKKVLSDGLFGMKRDYDIASKNQ